MQTHTTIQSFRRARATHPGTLGLVPTMGALHAGHLSLIAHARAANDRVAATIFVNPLQFAAGEDFDRYPRSLADDLALLEQAGVDLVFTPTAAEIYPTGATTTVDPGPIATRLDGRSRPGHFLGVATVVTKLLNITEPTRAYFGQKDAAQLAILRHIARDLHIPTDLVACPTVRDPDGLALSSRNRYLTPAERAQALTLPRTLAAIQEAIARGTHDRGELLAIGHQVLAATPQVRLDYVEITDPDTLEPIPEATPGALIAIAATVGTTRLIDNLRAPCITVSS